MLAGGINPDDIDGAGITVIDTLPITGDMNVAPTDPGVADYVATD